MHLLAPFLRQGRAFGPIDAGAFRRILIIRPQRIGDLVITLPTVDALRRAAPQAEIDLVVGAGSRGIVQDDPRFARTAVFRPGGLWPLFHALRGRRYDCVLDLIDGDSATGLLLSQHFGRGGALRIGEAKNTHAPYYDAVSPPLGPPRGHAIERSLATLEPLGIDLATVDRHAPPFVSRENAALADRFLGGAEGAVPEWMRIGVNLSAGKESRQWPAEQALEAIRQMLEDLPPPAAPSGMSPTQAPSQSPVLAAGAVGHPSPGAGGAHARSAIELVIITAPEDRPRGEWLLAELMAQGLVGRNGFTGQGQGIHRNPPGDKEGARGWSGDAFPGADPRASWSEPGGGATVRLVPPGLSILAISAIVARLSLLISPDTSLVHIARSANVPVVGLYPTAKWNLERWYPYGQPDGLGVVVAPSGGLIADILPETVVQAVRALLSCRSS